MPKSFKEISLHGEKYFSVPGVASQLSIHRATLSRWASRGESPDGKQLRVVRDKTNGHLYIAAGSVEKLKQKYVAEARFEPIGAGNGHNGNGHLRAVGSTRSALRK